MKLMNFIHKLTDKVASEKRTKLDYFLSFGCLVLSLVIMVSTITYSWMRRSWSSTIQESQLKIESNGSLAFQLDTEREEYTNSISLLQQIGDLNFTLKPVSNFSGESDDFFCLNKDVQDEEKYSHISAGLTASDRMNVGKSYGYIEFYFRILGESVNSGDASTTTKFVYLESSSFFGAYGETVTNAPYALRISITTKNSLGQQHTLIFKQPSNVLGMQHQGVNNTVVNGNWIANGASYWDETGLGVESDVVVNGTTLTSDGVTPYPILLTNPEVYQLSDFFGGITTDTDTGKRYIDEDQCLCRFSSSEWQDVVIRIWIEGTDSYCTDEITGSQISLLLSFGAVNCALQNDGRYMIVEHTATQNTGN